MKKTTDIKIKKIEVKKVEPIKIEELRNKRNFNFSNFDLLKFLKEKIAYISFGFMSLSIATYIFFISSIIVFAVQERSFIFSTNQVEIKNSNVFVQNKDESEVIIKKDAQVENLALANNVLYIKRISDTETALSIR